jgi:hypothetical protein
MERDIKQVFVLLSCTIPLERAEEVEAFLANDRAETNRHIAYLSDRKTIQVQAICQARESRRLQRLLGRTFDTQVDADTIDRVVAPRIVMMDETEHWNRGDIPEVTRIYGWYLYDWTTAYHLCEFTPSYEMNGMPSEWNCEAYDQIPDDRNEFICEYIRVGDFNAEHYSYMACHEADDLPGWYDPILSTRLSGDSKERMIEDYISSLACDGEPHSYQLQERNGEWNSTT